VRTAAALLALAGFLLWYARSRFLMVTVRGHSMMPTFRDGQRVLVRRTGRRVLRPGDVAVFAAPVSADGDPEIPQWLVKRVTAVAGDPVPLEIVGGSGGAGVIPPGHCVVRGDNPRSLDSRHFGYLPEKSVLGVVRLPRRQREAHPRSREVPGNTPPQTAS
jgi:signal peptidase I